MIVWIWLTVVVVVVWMWLNKKYSYFKNKGIKHLPTVPFLGNLSRAFINKQHLTKIMETGYNSFPNERYYGTYELVKPMLVIKDLELIRKIGIKDFDYFVDHRTFGSDTDPFFSKSLIGLKGQNWRDMRSTLSPAFTGSKLRNMIPLIVECNKDMMDSIEEDMKESGYVDVDTHDLLTRLTNDVIATTAFGVKANSFNDKENHFYKMGKKVTTLSTGVILKLFIVTAFPFIQKLTNIRVFAEDAVSFLGHIVLKTLKDREENNLFRPDMIQLLLEAKKGTLKHENVKDEKDAGFATVEESHVGKNAIKQLWDDESLVAQAFLFFFAGFDTVSTCMKFLLLELALNPDVQDKLRQEINEHHEKYDGKIDYEKVNHMKYMDMVVSETLRKWPPGGTTDRQCVKDYNLGKPNDEAENDIILEKGMGIVIPIWTIHHDPKYYPNPQKFDPERFSDENKHNVQQFSYLPFGIGPRNCIGSRFALVEVKVMAYELIRRFEVSPAPQTVLPPRLDKNAVTLKLEGGHWFRFKRVT